jgi:hypothetical protein
MCTHVAPSTTGSAARCNEGRGLRPACAPACAVEGRVHRDATAHEVPAKAGGLSLDFAM